MSDTDYMLDAVQEYWDDVLYAYNQHAEKKPIVLLDLQERRIYVYPYEGFKSELSPRSQASLADHYKRSIREKQIVVFVRDNEQRRLVSFSMPASPDLGEEGRYASNS